MCIGIPMKVAEILDASSALCEGKNEKGVLNTLLAGNVKPGDWVLAWNGMATRVITEERARDVILALDALTDGAEGKNPDVDHAFSDILENTGKLPPHLAALVKKGASAC
jgi:hydrogenase expression/formation protein HypC